MIKAVIFDMFETLITLFEGKTYFGEDIAKDVGIDPKVFRKVWHETEHDRSIGRLTIEEGLAVTFRELGVYCEERVKEIAGKRLAALNDTFSAIPDDSERLLRELHKHGLKTGLITNTFSDERDLIRECKLFPHFDAVRISYEQGVCKPDPAMYLSITEELGVKTEDCLYVGDGGSGELYAARDLGMKAVQASWFHERAFEPHIPCPLLPDFTHVMNIMDILEYIG